MKVRPRRGPPGRGLLPPRRSGGLRAGGCPAHLLTICPAGSVCAPLLLWAGATAGEERRRRQPGGPAHAGGGGGTGGPRPAPPPGGPRLTVAVREALEARGARLAPLPREVAPAVAAAGQVLARPVRELRLAVAAWWAGSRGGRETPSAVRSAPTGASASPVWAVGGSAAALASGAVGGPGDAGSWGPGDTQTAAAPAPGQPCAQGAPPRSAPLTPAGVGRVQGVVRGAVEAGKAQLAVDARGVVLGEGRRATESQPAPQTLPPPAVTA